MDDLTALSASLAAFVTRLQAADDAECRRLSTGIYSALQAAGLPEPAAAALQHQLVLVAQGLGTPTHSVEVQGATSGGGELKSTKRR